jgi:hypothetical protein
MMLFAKKPPDHRLRVLEVIERERWSVPEGPDLEAAKQRCLACTVKQLCDKGELPLSLFCPNIHYLKKVSGTFF